MTMLQLWAPRHLLARVMSVMLLAMSGTFPISAVLSGWAVDRLGVSVLFPVAGCAIIGAILWAVAQPTFRNVIRRRRRKNWKRCPARPSRPDRGIR